MFSANVITLQGMDAARALLAGNKTMVITRAVGGSGVSLESGLPAMTALPRVNQTLSIVCLVQGNSGPELLVRIASAGLENAYALHQIGIYARLDDEEEFLFQILQDENGVNVPAQNEAVGITMDLRIGLAVDVGEATVTLDSAAYVIYGQLQVIMGDVPRTRDSVAFSIDPNQWESSLTGAGTPVFRGFTGRPSSGTANFRTSVFRFFSFIPRPFRRRRGTASARFAIWSTGSCICSRRKSRKRR